MPVDRTVVPLNQIVVLRDLGLGDLLTGVPALRAVRAAFPDDRITLVAPEALAPLALATEAVDAVGRRPAPRPDVAVNLHGRGPQSHHRLLGLHPRRLITFGRPGIPGPEWRADEHEVRRWCRLLEECGVPTDPGDLDLRRPDVVRVPNFTVIHPGAASGARRWPAVRFAAVARAEAARGRTVVVTGSPDEVDLARRVADGAGLEPSDVQAGRTDVMGLVDLVASAGRIVCGDTGVAHVATAVRTPSVVLFGPTSPAHWGPPPERAWHCVLWAGRTGDPHATEPDPGLLAITADEVLAALDGLGYPGASHPTGSVGTCPTTTCSPG